MGFFFEKLLLEQKTVKRGMDAVYPFQWEIFLYFFEYQFPLKMDFLCFTLSSSFFFLLFAIIVVSLKNEIIL